MDFTVPIFMKILLA